MWFKRDISNAWTQAHTLPVRILQGVRQCGKSSLLEHLAEPERSHVTLDDLRARHTAQTDPALFFEQHPWPLTIDEVQHAPQLFPEIKLRVDAQRRARRVGAPPAPKASIWLTGSSRLLLEPSARESLAGRAGYFRLHTLSVHELLHERPDLPLREVFLRGGWPELHIDPKLDAVPYLNDYIRTYLERDIVVAAGISKVQAFTRALGLFAARTACPLNASEIAGACGVRSVTIQEWLGALEENLVVFSLPGYHDNLNKRLVKSPKLYFLDTGLAARLQGWSEPEPLLRSPQAGLLFETLVLGEIVRTRDHHLKDWTLHYWRTREGEEIDFLVLDRQGNGVALDAKLGVQSVPAIPLPASTAKSLPRIRELAVVSLSGQSTRLGRSCLQVPIAQLHDYLLEHLR
jgi:predicted AAA+ superfamily ATPase